MKRYEVIERKFWKNVQTGDTASIYGAAPYTSDADKEAWRIVTKGWTIRDNRENTVGRANGGVPFVTKLEADIYLTARHNPEL